MAMGAAAGSASAVSPTAIAIMTTHFRQVTFAPPSEQHVFIIPRLSYVDVSGDPRCAAEGENPSYWRIAEARGRRLGAFADTHFPLHNCDSEEALLRKILRGWRDGE